MDTTPEEFKAGLEEIMRKRNGLRGEVPNYLDNGMGEEAI
jgi:hypothetical protein